jgi:hypothetical protein
MVKILSFILFSVGIVSCSYVMIPRNYYGNYTNILNNKIKDSLSLNYNMAYVFEDTFLSRDYSKSLNKDLKCLEYTFFYKNNLMAQIQTPFYSNGNINLINEVELENLIVNGFFNNPLNKDKIDWFYFKIENRKLIKYFLEFNPSNGLNVLNKGQLKKSTYIILNYGYVYEDYFQNDSSISNINIEKPLKFMAKPDSSKADFIQMYKKYIETGSRRYFH